MDYQLYWLGSEMVEVGLYLYSFYFTYDNHKSILVLLHLVMP